MESCLRLNDLTFLHQGIRSPFVLWYPLEHTWNIPLGKYRERYIETELAVQIYLDSVKLLLQSF